MMNLKNQISGKYFLWLIDTENFHFLQIRAPTNRNEAFLYFKCQVKALLMRIK